MFYYDIPIDVDWLFEVFKMFFKMSLRKIGPLSIKTPVSWFGFNVLFTDPTGAREASLKSHFHVHFENLIYFPPSELHTNISLPLKSPGVELNEKVSFCHGSA